MATSVELLSNLVWLAVTISLWGFWLVRSRSVRKGSLFHAVGVQVIVLAMLTTILLPAISISDDLHACQLPAEIKRSVLQSDQHNNPAAQPSALPFALALLALYMNLLAPGRTSYVALEQPALLHIRGYLHSLWSRPPPTAAA